MPFPSLGAPDEAEDPDEPALDEGPPAAGDEPPADLPLPPLDDADELDDDEEDVLPLLD